MPTNLLNLLWDCARVDSPSLNDKINSARENPGWLKSLAEFKKKNVEFDIVLEYRTPEDGYDREGLCLGLVADNVFMIDNLYFDNDISDEAVRMFHEVIDVCAQKIV